MSDTPKIPPRGLLTVYTGGGKGKTTAALGLCVRAVGYGLKVSIVQFVKGSWHYGEIDGIKRLAPEVSFVALGKGFVGIIDDKLPIEEHVKAARATLDEADRVIQSGEAAIVILDELNVALSLNLLTTKDVLDVVSRRPPKMHVVCTGRGAPPELIEQADLVTEMVEIKHPFTQGMMAQKGFDF
jgi:cob(I)alamin adenosyltransferase